MMDKNKIVDHILFVNDKNPAENIIFNFHTWVEIIKAIMVKYANKSEDEAVSLMFASPLVNNALDGYMAIVVRCHELEYHWAMELAYGEQYWQKGISSQEPEDYFEWEEQYRKDHNLAEESFVFSD
ncbi:hypothetical protein [Serratia fonticola]|uniref:hypothetical protein n=1 Tax=Serratia fonticola TaxID=47917 RepID=UPI0003AEBB4D|nr:hypothetical protein [Serratia fonticola]ERK14435.1 hypothetical protein L581_1583 [Serratia fonticola AU-AP2C]MBP0995714.1 hypothetical protein [Serratia fonticola]MBP1000868.1 hypothetical protein [Serratia fonticola]MBP1010575.1 hypothetical protein [Serratia fonticola]